MCVCVPLEGLRLPRVWSSAGFLPNLINTVLVYPNLRSLWSDRLGQIWRVGHPQFCPVSQTSQPTVLGCSSLLRHENRTHWALCGAAVDVPLARAHLSTWHPCLYSSLGGGGGGWAKITTLSGWGCFFCFFSFSPLDPHRERGGWICSTGYFNLDVLCSFLFVGL